MMFLKKRKIQQKMLKQGLTPQIMNLRDHYRKKITQRLLA